MISDLCRPPTNRPSWLGEGFLCFSIILLVFAVYGQTIGFDFINYDDDQYITSNAHVLRGITLNNLRWAMHAGMTKSGVDIDWWRPLSMMSHMLDVQLFGLNAGAHHAMNVLFHALTATILFLLLRTMTGAFWRSAMVAAIWAVHPLRVESVAWVAERKDVLGGLFFVLTLLAYARYTRQSFSIWNYFLVIICFALGLMSKPMLVSLPIVLLLLDSWPLGRLGCGWRILLGEKLPLFAMSAADGLLTMQSSGGCNFQLMSLIPFPFRVGNAILSYTTYLGQTLWPFGLVPFYLHPGKNIGCFSVIAASILLMVVTLLVLWWRHKRPYLALGWFWYVGMLVPVIGIIQSGDQAHADRYTYLPIIGALIAVVWGVESETREWRLRKSPAIVCALTVILLACLSVIAWKQTTLWRNSVTLWRHTLSCTGENETVLNLLGSSLYETGKTLEAGERFRRALQFNSESVAAMDGLSVILMSECPTNQILATFRDLLASYPSNPKAHYDVATALLQRGEIVAAVNEYRTSLAIRESIDARSNLGYALLKLGQIEAAEKEFRKAVEDEPDNAAIRNNLGMALLNCGDSTGAIVQFRVAVELDPDNPTAKRNLEKALFHQSP